jgi:hypothetical protein
MDNNIVEFLPREEREELADMRVYWLAVRDDRDAMARIAFLTERVADILNETEIADADRQSLLWHLSLIRELAAPRSDRDVRKPELTGATCTDQLDAPEDIEPKRKPKLKPLCSLPRFNPPDGAA